MKIGIVSDSHGNKKKLEEALKEMGNIDMIFHLGDYVEDGDYLKTLTKVPVYIIRGNMDRFSEGGQDEIYIMVEGVKILACHGHAYGVKSDLYRLSLRGREKEARIVLFGHTHISYFEDDGQMLLMNPGSIGSSRTGKGESFGIIAIDKGQVSGEIIEIKK